MSSAQGDATTVREGAGPGVTPPPLKDYQVDGIAWLEGRPRAILADEAGLGKSVQLLEAAKEPVLIVAPAMVLESGTWDDEIEKWAPGIDATQVSYSKLAVRGERGKVERDFNGFAITPPKPEFRKRWGSVILDESHYIKGRKTSWTYAVQKLEADQIDLATGTPLPNWAAEAFTTLQVLFPGKAKPGHEFGSYWRWAKEWFQVEKDFFGAMKVGEFREDRTWEDFRRENWGDRFLQRLRDDVLTELPPLTRQEWRTPMGRDQLRVYKELRKNFVTWLDGLEISVWSEPGMLVKLAKVAAGLETIDRGMRPASTGKFKVLADILDQRPRQTFVVAHFRDTVDASADAARFAGKNALVVHGGIPMPRRREAIRAFQNGEIDVLCASIQSISEGVTLHQAGCDQMIRMERSWTPSKNTQVDRRLHRLGVERPIHIIDLITPNSIDERVLQLLAEKTDQQMHALPNSVVAALV